MFGMANGPADLDAQPGSTESRYRLKFATRLKTIEYPSDIIRPCHIKDTHLMILVNVIHILYRWVGIRPTSMTPITYNRFNHMMGVAFLSARIVPTTIPGGPSGGVNNASKSCSKNIKIELT